MPEKTKLCSKCGKEKPIVEFSKDRTKKSGFHSLCKVCNNTRCRDYNQNNKEKISKRKHKYRQENLEKERADDRMYYSDHREEKASYDKQRTEEYPLRRKVISIVQRAILSGKLIRPSKCEKCDCDCIPDAHHEDYSKPFEVNWWCRSCHMLYHRQKEIAILATIEKEEEEKK